jgi:apolipoprotein N-acyltransferase
LPADSASSAALKLDWSKSPWFCRVLAIVAGVALALSFQKTNIAGLAWIAPAVLLFAAQRGNSFRLGYLAGFVHYLISLSWLLHIPVTFYPVLGWLALCAYLALFPALWAWVCVGRVSSFGLRVSSWSGRTAFALFCAVAWVAMEMAIARMLTGFPWNLLGASQQKLLPLIQIASWTGQYGVSFLVVWFAASMLNLLNGLLQHPVARSAWLKELALPILVVAVVYALGVRQIKTQIAPTHLLRIALIQPSIPQTMIWNPAESDTRFAELLKLTTAALTNKPDLLIWPEAAMPNMLREDRETQKLLATLAINHRVWFIIGSDDREPRGTNHVHFNSSFLVSPRGELVSTYRKRRLVIFGEYVPLIDWLPFVKYLTPISGGFTAGERPVTFDFAELGAKTSVLICFEDVFPHYAREHASEDVDFLVNITNDGWFGESAAQWQHAASAAFRAVENGMPLVRCANNGVSCWIDRFGALREIFFEDSRNVYGAGFKIISLPLPSPDIRPGRTFYSQHGDWFGWSCVAMTLGVLIHRLAGSRQKPKK